MVRLLTGFVALLVLWATPARAEWRRAESPNFILYGNASESALRQRILLLEDFDRLLRQLTAVEEPPSANKLRIYIVSGIGDLRMIRPVPDGIAGYYIATPDGIAAFVDGRVEGVGNQILFHEYAHHFMRQHTTAAYPIWYVEGFAEYFSTVRFTERRIDIGNYAQGRAFAIIQGQWLPMERMLSGGIEGLSREQMSLYYAQSWLLVHYFYSNAERQAALARLLPALRREPPAAALLSATGLTPDGLTQELRRYIRAGQISYRQAPRGSVGAPPSVSITAMPRSTGDMIMFEAALRIGIAEENRQPYLQRIRAAAARHPDDPLAMRVLAHAELLYGDGGAADRLLDRLLANAPADAELLYLKGMRYLVLAESDNPPDDAAATARQWFTRAHTADPNHFQTLHRYVQILRGDREYGSDNTRNMLLLANRLAPQVASITMNAAILLIANRDYEQALRLLAPLAVNPHDAGLANAARQLMARAQREMTDGPRSRRPRPRGPNPDEPATEQPETETE